ncbi:methylmalonyl-CoA epimerase [Daejeonella sp.]|uniref:methylmalonyl-CoA epimerase n=1 Tax=Daejeonella sp. TaxID=2805397 RepID=UPI003983C90A
MKKIDHIGIAVKDLAHSSDLYRRLLGYGSYKTEIVDTEKVITEFFKINESKLELLQASSDESAIAKFIEKRGEGIHHIAFAVDNIVDEMARLKADGFQLLSEKPKKGADNKLVCFVHPKAMSGVLIELCESIER